MTICTNLQKNSTQIIHVRLINHNLLAYFSAVVFLVGIDDFEQTRYSVFSIYAAHNIVVDNHCNLFQSYLFREN